MLLAYSISEFARQYLVAAFVMLYYLFKIFRATQDYGEIVKGPKKSFIELFNRWLK